MRESRIIVGYEDYLESQHLKSCKDKLTVLNEAVKLASNFCDVDRPLFIKEGFANYLIKRATASEPENRRENIDPVSYSKLYGLPYLELMNLNQNYRAIYGDFKLSDCCTYFLKNDWNIYLETPEQITLYNNLLKLAKLLNTELKKQVIHSTIEQGLGGFLKHDPNGLLIPNILRVKTAK